MATRRAPGDLENEVLAVLWSHAEPLTTAGIRDRLPAGLAYTTVQTTLARLLAKGAVSREQAGRAHSYRPVLNSDGIAARRMRSVLDASGDTREVLSEFVSTLTSEEEHTLTNLLRRPMREPGANRPDQVERGGSDGGG